MYKFPEDLKKAFEDSPLSFVYYQYIDGELVPILASGGFCRYVGMDQEAALSWLRIGLLERIHPDDVGVISKVSEDFLPHIESCELVFRYLLGDKYVIIFGSIRRHIMPDGTRLILINYNNMSETNENMVMFTKIYDTFREDRFYSDPLTGIPNTNYMHEFADGKVDMIRSEGKTPNIVYVDVSSMQSYNNQYGFREGDKLLRLVAFTLKSLLPDALIVRGPDDHFIIITGRDDENELSECLNKANEMIKKKASGNTSGIRCGVCSLNGEIRILEAVDHAKHALKSISSDMNRVVVFFSKEAEEAYKKSRYIIENIDQAVENGWIKVYYQAIYRVKNRKIAAFEALARWIDPVHGTISPGEFIPVLQRYRQLHKLDIFMFEQVCREISVRYDSGLPLIPVSINFSRRNFDHVDIVGEMNRLYDEYNLERYVDKSYLIVEITEQDVAVGAETFRDQLRKIRENGYGLWLDDFGSGYSSLNMFSRFEFDLIKYDMDLLHHLDDNGGVNRLILRELVKISKELGIHTLTEGLENEEQLDFLREIGCELVQGFYFYKPEPLDSILSRIGGGEDVKPCETREERDLYEQQWFE